MPERDRRTERNRGLQELLKHVRFLRREILILSRELYRVAADMTALIGHIAEVNVRDIQVDRVPRLARFKLSRFLF